MKHVEIIAEIGSNHGGDFTTALKLIQAAKEAGADCAKFQHYGSTKYGPHPMPRDWLFPLQNACYTLNMDFLCSVFDLRTLEEYLNECEPLRVKIASPELTDHKLLTACAEAGLDIILSTGMSTPSQIADALEAIFTAPRLTDPKVTLLHCVSSYPAPPDQMNLRAMVRLGDFAEYGLSDHSLNPVAAPVAAVALGATVVEKHFTLARFTKGPDHVYALDPLMFKVMVDAVRLTELMLGDGEKRVQPSEDATDRRTKEWRTA